MTAIINATLVMRDHLIPKAALLIENGKIHSFGEMRKFSIPEGCEIIDAKDQFVGPALWTSTPTPTARCSSTKTPRPQSIILSTALPPYWLHFTSV